MLLHVYKMLLRVDRYHIHEALKKKKKKICTEIAGCILLCRLGI